MAVFQAVDIEALVVDIEALVVEMKVGQVAETSIEEKLPALVEK